MIEKLLIANRGDSACRIARACQRLGVAMATVHSGADRLAAHVLAIGESIELGAAAAGESYLDIPAIVAAAKRVGADAVHPGIGFLSETPEFAEAVEDAGLIFVGPTADTLRRFGDKMRAKAEASAAGIPVIAGAAGSSANPEEIAAMVAGLAAPALLKAAAGGGGRGMRVLRDGVDVAESIASAMHEAEAAFGRPDLLVEQYLPRARHVEVQVAGDGEGAVLHLFDRDCSLQRRHQKVVEEAPVAGLAEEMRAAILASACRLAARARLRSLATVEYLVVDDAFYFLEVNPRLQVEHSVTEMVTGLDLVEWQLRIAAGEGLPCPQDQVTVNGHAIQARLYAEDPENGFAPATGIVRLLDLPGPPIRVDLGVRQGEEIGPHYDSMIAKLAAHGADRATALANLGAALAATTILGPPTNLVFLRDLLARPEVIAGVADTAFMDRGMIPARAGMASPAPELFAIAGAIALSGYRQGPNTDPWTSPGGFTNWRQGRGDRAASRRPALVIEIGGERAEIAFSATDADGAMIVRVDDREFVLRLEHHGDHRFVASVDGNSQVVSALGDGGTIYLQGPFGGATATVSLYSASWDGDTAASDDRILAPVMGQVTKILVKIGDRVETGDVLVVQESMKMELRLLAPHAGVVTALTCAEGDMLERHGFVAEVRPTDNESAPDPG